MRGREKGERKEGGEGGNKEELSRSGAWALAFRHWPGWTTRLNNRRYVTGVYAFTDEEAGKEEEREATVPTGRERGGEGGGGGGRGRGRRGSQRSVQGGDHGGRSPTYGSQWHLEARTLFFSFLPFLACPQPLSLHLLPLLPSVHPTSEPGVNEPAPISKQNLEQGGLMRIQDPGSFNQRVDARSREEGRELGMDKIGVRIVNGWGWRNDVHELCSLFGEGKGRGREKLQALIFGRDVSSVPERSNLSIPRIERVVDHFDNANRLVKSKW